MKTAVICFTNRGAETAARIAHCLTGSGADVTLWFKKAEAPSLAERFLPVTGGLSDWAGDRFQDTDVLIFTGAAGIAVRAVAAHVKSKKTDPAVLCVDETGKYVIPLLSGHIGGANEQALLLAAALGAEPVITTATDLNGKFAVDVFARKNRLWISDMTAAKRISAALLEEKNVELSCRGEITGPVPQQLTVQEKSEEDALCVRISPFLRDRTGSALELYLVPAVITLGIGCRQGKDPGRLIGFAGEVLRENGISPHAVERVCSIDRKKDEAAICRLAEHYSVPFDTFSAGELAAAPGDYTASRFVKEQMGVDNVCERSAVLGSGGGMLLVRKTARDGMTAAAAIRKWGVSFE